MDGTANRIQTGGGNGTGDGGGNGRAQFTPREFADRRAKLQERLRNHGLAGCMVTQNVGIYYFAGTMQAGYLFIPAEGEATFYVVRSLARAQQESHVRAVPLGSFRQFGRQLADDYPSVFASSGRPAVGADLDVMPARLYLRLAEAVPQVAWADASAHLRTVRSVKSPAEIAQIAAVGKAADAVLTALLQELKEGMTELEAMGIVEAELRRRGHAGVFRMRGYNQETISGFLSSGEAAAEPSSFDGPVGGRGLSPASPVSVSRRKIGRNEPILLDIGCCLDGYVIDQTRIAVIGRLPDELQRAYEISLAILRRAEQMMKPGNIPEAVYLEALLMAEEAGLADHFMGYGRDRAKFLGHGVGLEIDEWPVLARGFTEPLEPGMVLAVEPKFIFPGLGAVGIENTYVLTKTGSCSLSVSPETVFELPLR
jgi:Xaa-Pro aminopeptidase